MRDRRSIREKRSFAGAWTNGLLSLAPAACFYEANYEDGAKSVRWRIWLKDEPDFAIAGLWRAWPREARAEVFSFAMRTVNSDKHPLMNRIHVPGKEKRMIVIVPKSEWDDWLTCRDPDLARSFTRHYPAERMAAESAPQIIKEKA